MGLPRRSLEDEGKSDGEDTEEPALFTSLVRQGKGRGSPWRKEAGTVCDPFCPHPPSPGQYLGSQ